MQLVKEHLYVEKQECEEEEIERIKLLKLEEEWLMLEKEIEEIRKRRLEAEQSF